MCQNDTWHQWSLVICWQSVKSVRVTDSKWSLTNFAQLNKYQTTFCRTFQLANNHTSTSTHLAFYTHDTNMYGLQTIPYCVYTLEFNYIQRTRVQYRHNTAISRCQVDTFRETFDMYTIFLKHEGHFDTFQTFHLILSSDIWFYKNCAMYKKIPRISTWHFCDIFVIQTMMTHIYCYFDANTAGIDRFFSIKQLHNQK